MKPFTLALSLLSLFFIPLLPAADAELRFYTREIEIPQGSSPGQLTICPVFDDKEFAYSARWDDSNRNHYRMQALMQQNGFKGTFFLNHKPDQKSMNFQKLNLLNADLGAHSMTHARIASEININRMFWEVAEIRAIIEAEADQPINSYCFSDGNFRNMTRKQMQRLIAESLQRVGYIHNMDKKFVDSLPQDLDPVSYTYYCTAGNNRSPSLVAFEKNLQKMLSDPDWQEDQPVLSMGVHVWMPNQKSWDAMESIYQKYANQEQWWYCTQTEYAAYQKLIQQADISVGQPRENHNLYTIRLPYGADIGSNVSLTLRYSEPTTGILIDGVACASRTDTEGTVFNVGPPPFASVPQLISYQPMDENPPVLSKEPIKTALTARLELSKPHTLSLTLKASPESQIENLRIRYILPPKYQTPAIQSPQPLLADETRHIELPLQLVGRGEYLWGRPFLLCQIDYLNHEQPERVYTSIFEPTVPPPLNEKYRDNSYVSTFFTDRQLWEQALLLSIPGTTLSPSLEWIGASDEERLVFNENISDMGERLRLELKNKSEEDQYFMIVSNIMSTKEGTLISKNLRYTTELYLNGQRLSPKNGDPLPVKQGENRLITIHKVNKFTGRLHHNFTYTIRGSK
ncbi:hypothetical protein P3T73_18395 [Kiritimatiellota bacterium B12222]|nr:hypothetical protein P3T73_18395 [Kiritimatiellota bacterium B12222]